MKIVPAKCPNCGANINVDEEQETTKCEYCGDAILIDRAIQKYQVDIKITNIPDLNNYLVLGERSYNDKDYTKSCEYYNNAITLDPNNYLVVLRIAISEVLEDSYNISGQVKLNNAISNSIQLTSKDNYGIIIEESLSCTKIIESRLMSYYDNKSLYRNEVSELNNKCVSTLSILKELLSLEESIEDEDQKKRLLENIIEFTNFVIKPKVYKSKIVNKNGKRSKYSLKIKRKKLKEIYSFWNSSIDKYNTISDEKINNKKMPLIQLDFQTIKYILSIILLIILCIFLIWLFFFNKETFGEYESVYICNNYDSIDISEISSSKYNKDKLSTYLDKIYIFNGKIYQLSLDGDHPYFAVNYNGVKIYINKEEESKLKDKKNGDTISFCGIVKESKFDKVKIENTTIIE